MAKNLLILLLMLVAVNVHAVSRLVVNNGYVSVPDTTSGTAGAPILFTGNSTAISVTLNPRVARCISIDAPAGGGLFSSCFEASNTTLCGSAAPTTTSTSTMWEHGAAKRYLTPVSGTAPDRMWLQPDDSNTLLFWHARVCD